MENSSKGAGKDRSNDVVPGSDVQGVVVVGSIVCQQRMGNDRGDDQGPVGVPPPGGAMDYRAESKMWNRNRVGVPTGSGSNGRHEDPPHSGVK